MGRMFGLVTTAVAAAVLSGVAAAPAAASTVGGSTVEAAITGSPSVTVTPSRGLAGGQTVTVTARGLPAATTVQVQQCPLEPIGPPDEMSCTNRVTRTTSATGTLRIRWTLQDPVYFQYPYGDPDPKYCRADDCRIWVSVVRPTGDLTNYSSTALVFLGSPATVTATPSAGLIDGQLIQVTGTAIGSSGDYVRLVQQACFSIIQGSGCNGAIDLGLVPLTDGDTFTATVPVSRLLSDGQDCADPVNLLDTCGITAIVLDADGEPDDTFGVGRLGDPSAYLEFATP